MLKRLELLTDTLKLLTKWIIIAAYFTGNRCDDIVLSVASFGNSPHEPTIKQAWRTFDLNSTEPKSRFLSSAFVF